VAAVVLYLLYGAVVVALAELARRRLEVPPDVTRKAVLALTSLGALGAVSRPGLAGAFLIFGGVLYLSFRHEILASLEDEGPTLGSVLAPLSLSLLIGVLGSSSPHIAGAASVAMVGDGAAALVGRRRGTRKYHLLGHPRTMEGTLTLFLVASALMAPVLRLLGGLDWHQAVAFALIAGTVAASVETISVHGTDNATVPLSVAATLLLLTAAAA
jgi:dolichol kinase